MVLQCNIQYTYTSPNIKRRQPFYSTENIKCRDVWGKETNPRVHYQYVIATVPLQRLAMTCYNSLLRVLF